MEYAYYYLSTCVILTLNAQSIVLLQVEVRHSYPISTVPPSFCFPPIIFPSLCPFHDSHSTQPTILKRET